MLDYEKEEEFVQMMERITESRQKLNDWEIKFIFGENQPNPNGYTSMSEKYQSIVDGKGEEIFISPKQWSMLVKIYEKVQK